MKTLVAAVVALALAVPAIAQESTEATPDYSRVIVGGAMGFTLHGPDHMMGNTFSTYAWAGARIKKWNDGLSLFAAGQHLDIDGSKSSSGAKLIAAQEVKGAEWLSILVGGGFLSDMALDIITTDSKGEPVEMKDKAGYTFDLGFSISPTSRIVLMPMLHAVDRGDLGTDVTLTLAAGLKMGAL